MTEENIPQGTAPPSPEAVQNDEASAGQVDEMPAGQIEGKNPPSEEPIMRYMTFERDSKSSDSPPQSNDSPEE